MAGTTFVAANWTGYDEQSVTNPGSALTDFTLLIDISTLSASWKAACESDAGDIRCTKGDGTTELPLDVIDWAYNAGSPTGWIRVKWSSTLAASGTQEVRVYCGKTSAVAYDANETYGSDNAYDSSWEGYWPLEEDPSGSSPQAIDRTSNSVDLTAEGSMVAGDLTSQKVGSGWNFDGQDEGAIAASTIGGWSNLTMMAWFMPLEELDGGYFCFGYSSSNDKRPGIRWDSPSRARCTMGDATNYSWTESSDNSIPVDTRVHIAFTWTNGSNPDVYIDGSLDNANSASSGTFTTVLTDYVQIGRGVKSYGNIEADDAQIHSAERTADWIAEEYAQSNSQSTFWGTWAWTATAGGLSIPIAMHHYKQLMGAN